MSTDLAALTAAAERWEGMAKEFARQEKAYRREVYGITLGPAWAGMSAEAAHGRFGVTLKEFAYAQTEAKAVASLLRDAHAQFTELAGRLTALRQEARAAGVRVSERGFVSADPDHGDGGPTEAAVHGWQERFDRAVRDVTDADAGVRIALAAVVADEDPLVGGHGFNGRAQGDIERYEALEAEGLLKRLSGGGTLSGRELDELRRQFRDNADDRVFARTLLDGLGASGTLVLGNELNDLVHVRGGPGAGTYATIEAGLADTLATATRDTRSPWYRQWRDDMRQAGVAYFATDAQGERLDKAVGYQSLATLMSHGHGYAPVMLRDLTDDMIGAERREPGIWRLRGDYAGPRGGWFANDPVDGMLGIMSHDPQAAAAYLGSDERMRYLTGERDWNVVLHGQDGVKAGSETSAPDRDDRAGFGAALRAATTGVDPADPHAHYVPHSAGNTAVLTSALHHLSERGDDLPPSLRRPLAAILVNHGATVHASMSEIDISRSPLAQDELFEVVKQVSKDEGAYGTLNGGLNQAMVAGMHGDGGAHSGESLNRAGRTVGFLEEARIQSQGDPKTAEFETKPFFDTAISYIPVVSDDVQAGFDYVTDQWLADEQERLDKKQSADNVQAYSARNQQLVALAREWSRVHGTDGDSHFDPQTEISRSASDGIDHATGISGVVPK
uniref:hypothetical protein n=1 Tax=Streptomyces corallincola TaxID=2851888 RepID=UPI0027E259C1|nr:hypothetical protein [Streptomyces corallincola]